MQDEHLVAIVSFEGAVKREVTRLREKLKPAAEKGVLSGNEFYFIITASGRILDGELLLKYSLQRNSYEYNPVAGNSPNAVTDEFLRRAGWEKINAPLAISAKPPVQDNDEIPF